MQCFFVFFCIANSVKKCRVLIKFAVTNCNIYSLQFLVNNAPGSQVKVANFGIAHLPIGQANRFATGNQGGMRVSIV